MGTKTKLVIIITIFIAIMALVPNVVRAETYQNLTYEIENGEVTITGIVDEDATEVIIPEEINGYKVTKIGESVFIDCSEALVLIVGENEYAKQYAIDNGIKYKYSEDDIFIEECIVTDIEVQIYTGEEVKPSVLIKYNDKQLVEEVDYKLSFDNNIDVGVATVRITGIGNYVGTVRKEFRILQKSLIEIIDAIPDTMNIDISEIQYEYATKEILEEIKSIVTSKNIEYEEVRDNAIKLKDITYNGDELKIYVNMNEYINKFKVSFGENSSMDEKKYINVIYNNSDSFNEEDENYIKNLNLAIPDYYIVNSETDVFSAIKEYYDYRFNDASLQLLVRTEAGDITGYHSILLMIFKNDIYYGTFDVNSTIIYRMIIPNEIVENNDAYIEYALPIIKKDWDEAARKKC